MSVASHLPQLVANALATVIAEHGLRPEELGPGGRDMTRLAASSPAMWADLLAYASPELGESLRAVGRLAERLADLLEEGDMDSIDRVMRDTRSWRGSR
jgi:prephenate dehydrogenase